MLFAPFFVLAAYMTALYAIALIRDDNGTADIGYGIGFIVFTSFTLWTFGTTQPGLIMTALVLLWGMRLAIRIGKKNWNKPEDFRYRAWREVWGTTFYWRSYLQIYLLQGAVIACVALPVYLSIVRPGEPIGWLFGCGVLLWCIGFLFEVLGDYQLDAFIKNPENKGKIMMSGLWAYSRHPNYFGEATMWFGMALMATAVSSAWIFAWASPLLITFLLLKVSGVPLLEKRWEGNPDWESYKARTSVFIPLPPRSGTPQ